MQRLRFLVSFFFAIAFVGLTGLGMAQAPVQNPPRKLPHLAYDVARNGPLLAVFEGGGDPNDLSQLPPEQQEAMAAWMDARGKRIVVGGVTVVAPKTMQVIETRPAKPDPYAGLKAHERLQVLLSLFDGAQWAQAGSTQGIGVSDLNDNQRALFLSLLPEKMTVERTHLVPGDKPGEMRYEPQGMPKDADPMTARLRLVRKVNFMFSRQGADDYNFSGNSDALPGDVITRLTAGDEPRGDKKPDADTIVAMGVPIVYSVPNRLKPGGLDFADPKLRVSIALDGNLKTLADLLNRVATATGLDLTADKRVGSLPLLVRTLPRRQALGGDLLKALCWSVTGAFRRVGTSTYLLTDDVVGIGVRFARLEEWAEEASAARYKAMDGVKDAAVKHDPLSHLGFAPGDSYGLPSNMMRQIDDTYRKERYHESPEFKFTDLPASLQQSVTHQAEYWAQNGMTIRTDRVRVGMELSVQFVLPGGMAVTPSFSQNIGSQYLQAIAVGPAVPAPHVRGGAQAAPPKPMSAAVPKRVLVARLPADDMAVGALLSAAKAKGFTEVWLQVRLDDPQASERLVSAQVAGRKLGLFLGCAVSLLRGGGMPGEEDVNIFGETGAAFVKRKVAAAPQNLGRYARLADWTLLSADQTLRLLTPLAEVPGLSALTLKASAAPGSAGDVGGGDGIPTNGHLGYDLASRLACLQTEGFDPVDIGPYPYSLETPVSLHFFPDNGLWKTLGAFRLQQNHNRLAQVHKALHKLVPQLSLYLDDRASAYTDPTLRWFGRWDDPARMVVNPVYFIDSEGREAAFANSPEPLLRCPPWNGKPEGLAAVLGETSEKAVKKWPGIALDLTGFAPADALKQLGGLPVFPASLR